MNEWTLTAACARARGFLHGSEVAFAGVTTDSRGDCRGKLFVALRGPRFDGHDYVAAAVAAGAVAALVERPLALAVPHCVVTDTRVALGELARAWRERLAATVVALTGSNGKTTCKTLIAAILDRVAPTRATPGNLNNDIGLPLTLLGTQDERYLVLEMGANHPGEIATLTAIARPQVALIVSIGRAHLEGFGSIAGVARAKGEIALGLPADGVLVVPAASPWEGLWRDLAAGRRLLTFGCDPRAAVRVVPETIAISWEEDGFRTRFVAERPAGEALPIALRLAGEHNISNALAAIAVASALGVPDTALQAGLAAVAPVARRLQPHVLTQGARLLDDSYNANPESFTAALAVLSRWPGRKLIVLGDFGELGPDSPALHAALGQQARAAGVAQLYALGDQAALAAAAFGAGGQTCATHEELIDRLRATLSADDAVLIKGSRRAGMERIADALLGDS